MKYLYFLSYVIYLLLIIALAFIIIYPSSAVADPIIPVKTIDSEIERLSIVYSVAPSTARAIITCESQMYGSAVNHNRLPDGTIWSSDFGPFQINDYFHEKTMTNLGLDIHNQFDSLEYGFILLSKQGVGPWYASKKCWSKLI